MVNIKETVSYEVSGKITREDLIREFGLPQNTEIFFAVPGGGDYSNMNLDITEEDVIHFNYKTSKEKETKCCPNSS